jgi:two-component system response regulator GlrR
MIIMKAHSTLPDAVAATQQDVFSFITKPINREEFISSIQLALQQTSQNEEEYRSKIVNNNIEM